MCKDNAVESDGSYKRDETFMRLAIEELKKCSPLEVPVAAVVVCGDSVIASGVNARQVTSDPTAHAEVVAIRAAAAVLERWNLSDCELYVTMEPCVMCAGTIVYSRIKRVVFGAFDKRFGAAGSIMNLLQDERLNHRAEVRGGVCETECLTPIREFFAAKRQKR